MLSLGACIMMLLPCAVPKLLLAKCMCCRSKQDLMQALVASGAECLSFSELAVVS
jgi:hypothetical protein